MQQSPQKNLPAFYIHWPCRAVLYTKLTHHNRKRQESFSSTSCTCLVKLKHFFVYSDDGGGEAFKATTKAELSERDETTQSK